MNKAELNIKDIAEIEKVSEAQIKYTDYDNNYKVVDLVVLNSRKEALELLTSKALSVANEKIKAIYLGGGFKDLDSLRDFSNSVITNNYERLRNYEIESYFEGLGLLGYRIKELCPINGFMWFD